MLILSRRPKDSLRVGENIIITILDVQGEVVRLGIDAPKGVTILREELYLQVCSENIAAMEVEFSFTDDEQE